MKTIKLNLPCIPEESDTPLVAALLDNIERLYTIVLEQQEIIQQLRDENARLKNGNQRPVLKPSKLNTDDKDPDARKNKDSRRPGSAKRSKTAELTIHSEKIIEPDNIPAGSRFKGYKDFVVQDIVIEARNTKYRLAVYKTPDGGLITGKLPDHLDGKHFGSDLICFCLHQYYHCAVV